MEKLKLLKEDLPEGAIQRSDGKKTGKMYNTTGYGYQYIVDRFNDVYGKDWGYNYDILDHTVSNYSSGAPRHDVTVNIGIWIENDKLCRVCVGGHDSKSFGDALKGAITNGFKKTAAFWGVGADAYRGTIDDDNQDNDDKANDNTSGMKECPECEVKAIIKGKAEYGGGHVCWKQKGGCGAKFNDDMSPKAGNKTETKQLTDQDKARACWSKLKDTSRKHLEGLNQTEKTAVMKEVDFDAKKVDIFCDKEIAEVERELAEKGAENG